MHCLGIKALYSSVMIVDFERVRPLLEIDSVGFAQRTFLAYLADTYRSVFISLALSLSMDYKVKKIVRVCTRFKIRELEYC